MPIHRILQNGAFDQAQIDSMVYAFEAVCVELKLRPNPDDPERERVANAVIKCAQRGITDPMKLRDAVLQAMKLGGLS